MLTLFTTSWTIKCPEKPNHLKTSLYFEDLVQEFFDLEISKHPDYIDVYVFSLTYPAYQAQEYGKRIMQYCAMMQEIMRPCNLN